VFESTVIVCETTASTTAHPCALKIEVHKRLHCTWAYVEIPAVNVRHKQFWSSLPAYLGFNLMDSCVSIPYFTDIYAYTRV